jgi:hypothetical protein
LIHLYLLFYKNFYTLDLHGGSARDCKTLSSAVFVSWKLIFEKLFFKLFCVCLLLGKLVNGKHFPVKEKFGLISRKVFSFYFGRKTFSGSCEKFRNVILFVDYIKFNPQTFIAIYILFWIFIFQIHPVEFNFYINFGPYFYNCYLFFPYHFLIEIFYLSNLVLILLIITYFIWNYLWNVNYYYFNFFIFQFFYFLDLISIILIIINFILDNLWNYIFFQFHSHSTFLICKICSSLF